METSSSGENSLMNELTCNQTCSLLHCKCHMADHHRSAKNNWSSNDFITQHRIDACYQTGHFWRKLRLCVSKSGGYIDSSPSGGVQRHSLTLNPQTAMEDSDTIDCENRWNLEKNIRRGFSSLGSNMLHNNNSKHSSTRDECLLLLLWSMLEPREENLLSGCPYSHPYSKGCLVKHSTFLFISTY